MSSDRLAQKRREQRQRRRGAHRSRTVVLIGVLLVVAAVVWLVGFSGVFAARTVKVQGTQLLSAQQVQQRAEVRIGQPLARIDTNAIAQRIRGLKPVERVTVRRAWPRTVQIDVQERTPVAWARIDNQVRGVDRLGVDFRTYRRPPRGLTELRAPSLPADKRQRAFASAGSLLADLAEKDRKLLGSVRYIEVESRDSVVLVLSRGRSVMWGSAGKTSQKLRVLRSLLEAVPAKVYDVSAPDRPTTKE